MNWWKWNFGKDKNYDGLTVKYGDIWIDVPRELHKFEKAMKEHGGDEAVAKTMGRCENLAGRNKPNVVKCWFPREGKL